MKSVLLIFFLTMSFASSSQQIIEWSPDVQLTLQDFQSPETEINPTLESYSVFTGTNMDFSYQMNAYAFMMTKNFNSKAKTLFNRNAAVVIAPDTATANHLVNFAQYNFDLSELYTRKFRKRMYAEKGAFSDPNFFRPIFDDLNEKLNAETARVMKASDLGRKEEILASEHEEVLLQIDQLHDYCFDCKPPKKKRKKKS